MDRIPVHAPLVGDLEAEAVAACIRRGELSGGSPVVGEFERAFAAVVGTRHAIAVTSGTTALHLALRAAGVGPGDEVIVPTLTFAPCADMIALCGATPVFADSRADTFNVDANDVLRHFSPRTSAVLCVHLYGHPCDVETLGAVCRERGVALIEDCAQALGARSAGLGVARFGVAGCFSLYANKHITTGEGGMVATDDDEFAERARHLRNHALTHRPLAYDHDEVGFNYRLNAPSAALGLAQLSRLDGFAARRQRAWDTYRRTVVGLAGIRLQATTGYCEHHARWAHAIVVDPAVARRSAADLRDQLRERGIDTRPFFSPLHLHPPYRRDQPPLPVAEALARDGLVLPSGNALTDAQLATVCGALTELLA